MQAKFKDAPLRTPPQKGISTQDKFLVTFLDLKAALAGPSVRPSVHLFAVKTLGMSYCILLQLVITLMPRLASPRLASP